MAFKPIKPISYQPLPQIPFIHPVESESLTVSSTSTAVVSRAQTVIDEFEKTIQLINFVKDIVDTDVRKVTVQIDPDAHPEVWMAMQRLFQDTANPSMNGDSYLQVLEALREVYRIETAEADETTSQEDALISRFTAGN